MILSFLALATTGAATTDALVLDGYVLGCLTDDGWRSYRAAAPLPPLSMSAVGIGHEESTVRTATFGDAEGGAVGTVKGLNGAGVFFTGKALFPRDVVEDLKDRYAAIPLASAFARSKGVTNPSPYIVHVWKVELDKSGAKQEIIEVVSRPGALREAAPGDWQAVLLHWRENGRDRIFPLQASFSQDSRAPRQCRVRAIADFEGNGTMEIVTSASYDLGKSATLWSFREGKPLPLMDFSYSVSASRILGN